MGFLTCVRNDTQKKRKERKGKIMKFTYEKEYDNVFDELVDRGYYEQATNEEELKKNLQQNL